MLKIPAPILARYLAIGAILYALMSLLWLGIAWGVGQYSQRWLLALLAICDGGLIGWAGYALRKPRTAPDDPKADNVQAMQQRLGQWFAAIFAGEGIAIGVGSALLAALGYTAWITPLVALVVGLHFFPLGRVLRLRSDYLVGAAFVLLVLGAVLLVENVDGLRWTQWIGLGAAAILWLAGLRRIVLSRQLPV